MSRRGPLIVLGVAIAIAAFHAFRLRLDLALEGALCRVVESSRDGEGTERLRCADGRRFRLVTQLSCSETLRCRLGVDCIDSLEPLAP